MNHASDRAGILKISASAIPSTGPSNLHIITDVWGQMQVHAAVKA
jgi:hypothetical protein